MKIGIDFGTSFSLPAGIINGAPATLLPNGEYGIPSVFYYDSIVGVQIGATAEDNADFQPHFVKRDIKMEISANSDSFTADGKEFSKKQIIGYILKEIARVSREEGARRELISQTIDGAVISVPAAFTVRELSFIREAAQDIESDGAPGLNVLGFIREPVAAAIAYFNAPSSEDEKTILVFDLGGGTCDVAIVRSSKNSNEWYKVIDSDMKRIGGRDWDNILISIIKRKYKETSKRLNFDIDAENRIRKQAIQAKHILSVQQVARVSMNIAGKVYSCVITLEEFEAETSKLLKSAIDIVSDLTEKCDSAIDYIVCVGGGSNMPQVRKAFEKDYPNTPVKLYEPEKAIAFGAAIYAEHLTEENYLSDICKFSYGIRFIEDYSIHKDESRLIIYNYIYKGNPLPATASTTANPAVDGYKSIFFALFESEIKDDKYKPEDGVQIGGISINGLVDSKKSDLFNVSFGIDKSGLLSAKAIEAKSGKSAATEIQLKKF